MDRTDRLKWIPMLAEAYSRALKQVAEQEAAARADVAGSKRASTTGHGRKGPAAGRRHKSSAHSARSHLRGRTLPGHPRPTVWVPRSPDKPRPTQKVPFRSVLRELRETKRRLDNLQTLHERLNHFENQLQNRFEELLQRLDGSPQPAPSEPDEPSRR
ncbi:MAG: hypothetical protein K6T63_06085 [Alicyclobacillus herbarius]|uniref:hypothetical protein n=1 Tax=Alicyclobacillus herbarius TaxID=122960 RepID=UPI002353B2F1|nr:hypothetical protein [Alicyclobacillus herbarius]MCL6632189.1 hypothetical protein [Alicyclobacillus herbarius]